MTFSKSWGYGVRALVHLAGSYEDPEHRWQAGELAEAAGLPSSFLSKVLHQLTQAGLVDSARGRGSGVRLAAPPEDIRLIDVARATEETNTLNLDASGFDDAPSPLKHDMENRWQPYRTGLMEFLAETTITNLFSALPAGHTDIQPSVNHRTSQEKDLT